MEKLVLRDERGSRLDTKRKVAKLRKALASGAALMIFGFMSNAALARTHGDHADGGCGALTGSYLITITDNSGNFASREVFNLTDDGNALVIDSNEGGVSGVSNPFTSAQGSWRCKAGHQVSAAVTVLDFSLPGPVQSGQSIARLDYQLSPGTSSGTISGTIDLRFFPLDGDPLTPPLPPPAEFSFSGVVIKPGGPG